MSYRIFIGNDIDKLSDFIELYIFNKTENKIYQFSFIDNIKFKNVKLNLRHKDRKKLTKKDILALDIIDLL